MDTARLHQRPNASSKWPQILAAFSATLGAFGLGNALAWTSPALPYIESDQCKDNCDISNVSSEEASWIGCLLPVGAILAGPITGFFLSRLGRRWTMILLAIPFVAGYGLFILAFYLDNKNIIFMGRILTGFAGGSFALAAPLYIVEISETTMRGSLASLMQFNVTVGVAFINGLNIHDLLHWNILSIICVIPPMLTAVSMFFMPESPPYLLSRGKDAEALASLQFLRGRQYDPSQEIQAMRDQEARDRSIGSISFKELLTKDIYVKPFLIIIMLMSVQQFSGVNAVIFYTQTIFSDAGSDMDPGLSAFLVGLAQILATGLAVLIVDKFGRRILLLLSTVLMCGSILALGVFFYMKENMKVVCPATTTTTPPPLNNSSTEVPCTPKEGDFDEDLVRSLGWLPLLSLVCYIVAFSIGSGPLPWTINAEIFSAEAKAVASSCGYAFNWFCALLVTKFYPSVEAMIRASDTYFIFAGICALGTVLIFFFLPETRGKTAEELKRGFMGKNKRTAGNAMTNPAFSSD